VDEKSIDALLNRMAAGDPGACGERF